MKLNPKIFEGFIDPSGGEWIRFKSGVYKDVCWRPVDLDLVDDQLSFKVEFFEGPGFVVPPETDTHFERLCGEVLIGMLQEAAALEVADNSLAADLEKAKEPKIITPDNGIILP